MWVWHLLKRGILHLALVLRAFLTDKYMAIELVLELKDRLRSNEVQVGSCVQCTFEAAQGTATGHKAVWRSVPGPYAKRQGIT